MLTYTVQVVQHVGTWTLGMVLATASADPACGSLAVAGQHARQLVGCKSTPLCCAGVPHAASELTPVAICCNCACCRKSIAKKAGAGFGYGFIVGWCFVMAFFSLMCGLVMQGFTTTVENKLTAGTWIQVANHRYGIGVGLCQWQALSKPEVDPHQALLSRDLHGPGPQPET